MVGDADRDVKLAMSCPLRVFEKLKYDPWTKRSPAEST